MHIYIYIYIYIFFLFNICFMFLLLFESSGIHNVSNTNKTSNNIQYIINNNFNWDLKTPSDRLRKKKIR